MNSQISQLEIKIKDNKIWDIVNSQISKIEIQIEDNKIWEISLLVNGLTVFLK